MKRTEKTVRLTPVAITAMEAEKRSIPAVMVALVPYLPAVLPDTKTPIPTMPTDTETIAPISESLMPYELSIWGTMIPIENLKRP
jgi:hypothetical protein